MPLFLSKLISNEHSDLIFFKKKLLVLPSNSQIFSPGTFAKTFGKYVGVIISDKSNFSFYIPKGFAHGFICLSDKCTVNYKCSDYRNSKFERTLAWNDPKLKIKWPSKKPILSLKDKYGLKLDSF